MDNNPKFSIDLKLPTAPLVYDPIIFAECLRIYNAIRTLAMGLDAYTADGNVTEELNLTGLDQQAQLLKLKKQVKQLSEDFAGLTFQINWTQPGRIGAVTPNSGAFTSLSATKTLKVTGASTLGDITTAKFGANGKVAASAVALPAAATDAASTQALANALRNALITFGLGS